MADQSDLVKQSEIINQLVIDSASMAEVGRVETLWMYPQMNRVLGFVCKPGLWGSKRLVFKLPQLSAFGDNSILTRGEPEPTTVSKVQQLQSLIHAEVWSDDGNRVGKITDCLFNVKTGVIIRYLLVTTGQWSAITEGVYLLSPKQIKSFGNKRVLIPEAVVPELKVYKEGIRQRLEKVSETVKEEYIGAVTDELRSLSYRAQSLTERARLQFLTLTEQARERAQQLSEQAKQSLDQINEQLREETQTFVERAKETGETFVQQTQETGQAVTESVRERGQSFADHLQEQAQNLSDVPDAQDQTVTVHAQEIPDSAFDDWDDEWPDDQQTEDEDEWDDWFDDELAEPSVQPPPPVQPPPSPHVEEPVAPTDPLQPTEAFSPDDDLDETTDFWDEPDEATGAPHKPANASPLPDSDASSPPASPTPDKTPPQSPPPPDLDDDDPWI